MATARTPLSEIISVSDVEWQERQPGIRMKSLWAHPETQRRAMITRIEPGAQLPRHRHVGDELVFVLEGAIGDELIFLIEGANADESGVVATGNMNYRPNGCVHTVTTTNGATVLAVVWGRTEPV